MNQKQTLTFSVDGEFITNLAREKFYEEDNLKAAIRLLWDCTLCDQMSEAEHIQLVIHILDGKASIVGIYPNDDYGIEYHKKPVIDNSILNHMDEITRRIRHNATNAEDYRDKFLFLCDNISDSDLILINDKYKNTYHAPLFPKSDENAEYLDRIQESMPNMMLQSVLENIKTESDDDYGWLEPNGTYHPVEWGKHAEWAMNWLNEHYPYREHADVYWVTINGKRKHVVAGDCLMYRFGWCLLDSPYQGVANPHYNSTKGLTKAQKEFLYDYYIQRNMHDRASAVYKDDSNVIPIINGI